MPSFTMPTISLPPHSKSALTSFFTKTQANLHSVARSVNTIVSPAQAALQMAKQTATSTLAVILPEPFAQKEAQDTVRSGVQWGAKVGGYFGPIGTVVGVSVGAATTIGLRYLMFDPNGQSNKRGAARATPVSAVTVAPTQEKVIAKRPPLTRARTF